MGSELKRWYSKEDDPSVLKPSAMSLSRLFSSKKEITDCGDIELSGDQDRFFTFYEFVEISLYNPFCGYYTNPRANRFADNSDFITFPSSLSPVYGRLFAIHAFNIWLSMRDLGILRAHDHFHIIEIGAGDGTLAFDLLNYCVSKSHQGRHWRSFLDALKYVVIDRSPYLLTIQLKKNKKFRKLLHFVEADITRSCDQLQAWSGLNGVIIANEVVDNFAHHKILMDKKGKFYVSVVKAYAKSELSKHLPFFNHCPKTSAFEPSYIPLSKEQYLNLTMKVALLNSRKMNSLLNSNILWRQARANIDKFPELHQFLKEYFLDDPRLESYIKPPRFFYISPDYLTYLGNLNLILSRGYVFTIDYGGRDDYVFDDSIEHMRMYGKTKKFFDMVGDKDITFNVNFRLLSEIGKRIGLTTVHYGPQRELADYYGINLRRYKKVIVEKQLSRPLLKFYLKILTKTGSSRKDRTEETDRLLKLEEEMTPYLFNTYLLSLIEQMGALRGQYKRKRIDCIDDLVEDIFEFCERDAEESIDSFYNQPSFRLLIQEKRCEKLYIYPSSI